MNQVPQRQLYKEQAYLFRHPCKVIDSQVVTISDPKSSLSHDVLRIQTNENIFHPQGGGQPNDTGSIKIGDREFQVDKIDFDRAQDIVYLEFREDIAELQALMQGSDVIEQIVNETNRKLFARLHSAGHLLDIALRRVGLPWKPGKGYHFPDSPYVEYIGSTEGINMDNICMRIQTECLKLQDESKEDDNSKVSILTNSELEQKMGEIPQYLKEVSSIRYVELCETDIGCPCGGTHVEHIKEIGALTITKVQKKGKNIRVSYFVN